MYEYVCGNVSSTIYVDLSCSVRESESVVSHSVVSHSSRLHVSSPPGSSVHGILQARMLEWVAMLSSRGSSQPRDQTQVFCSAGRLPSRPLGKPMNFY